MKYLLVLLEGAQSSRLNIDTLAANGRLGMIEGWSGMESLFGQETSDDGSITFTCSIASLDGQRNVSGFLADTKEAEELLEMINSIEIDGVKFQAEARGSDIILKLDGEGLSRKIVPNPCTPGMPLAQVCAAAKPAKKTAAILNKLIYRITKSFPDRAVFVKGVGAIQELPDNFELLNLNQDIDSALLNRIKTSKDLVTIIIWNRGSYDPAPALIHGGGLLGSGAKKFSEAACSRGFRIDARGLLPWVLRATS